MTWTVLVYIAAHDLKDPRIARCSEDSVEQMRCLTAHDPVRVLIQHDTPSGCVRRMIGAEPELVADLGVCDAGDPAILADFLRWGLTTAPADRYAVVLWSHGSGWAPRGLERLARQYPDLAPVFRHEQAERAAAGGRGFFSSTFESICRRPTDPERAIAFDDGTGNALDTLQLAEVLADATAMLGRPLDLIVMNACQMASSEVAYQIRPFSRVYVASEEDMPATSLPYEDILPELVKNPSMDAAALGVLMVDKYHAWYRNPACGIPWGKNGWPEGATLVAIDLARMEPLIQAIQSLTGVLQPDSDQHLQAFWDAHRHARSFPEFHLIDLSSFCTRLTDTTSPTEIRDAAQRVLEALNDPAFLLAWKATAPAYDTCRGVTIYLMQPVPGRRPSPEYVRLAYAQATGWGEWLTQYFARMA